MSLVFSLTCFQSSETRRQRFPDGTFPAVGPLMFDINVKQMPPGPGGWTWTEPCQAGEARCVTGLLNPQERRAKFCPCCSHKFSIKAAKTWMPCMRLGSWGGVSAIMVHLPVNLWSYEATDPKILSHEVCKRPKTVPETKDFQAENACGTEGGWALPAAGLCWAASAPLALHLVSPTFLACICNLVDCILSSLSQRVCCN